MRKKIFRQLLVLVLYALIFSAPLSTLMYYRFYRNQISDSLRDQSNFLVETYKEDPAAIEKIKLGDLRINLIDKEGKVLYDSIKDADSLENHKDRPEIKEAFASGRGKSVRYSTTFGKDTMYYANRVGEKVIRVSRDMKSVISVFQIIIPGEILIVIFLFLISISIPKRMTTGLVNPIRDAIHNPELEIYEELNPYFRKIEEQQKEINNRLVKEMEQNQTISTILSNMNEGLIIFDKEKRVLMINDSAVKILKPIKKSIGAHILEITSSETLIEGVNEAYKNKYVSGDVSFNGKIYGYFISPSSKDPKAGVILLLADKTLEISLRKRRDEFTSNVTHELKTPLTTISGFAELLSRGVEEDKTKEFGEIIFKQSQRLRDLIDDILKISKIESKSEKDFTLIDLKAIASDLVNQFVIEADKKNIELNFYAEPITIRADKEMMTECFENLLSNAIKYNKENGKVDFTIKREEDFCLITISDTGIGIKEEDIDRIYERFYVADKSRNKKTGSTGLGLSIVKHIVDVHKGKIELESQIDVGTKFKIFLPL